MSVQDVVDVILARANGEPVFCEVCGKVNLFADDCGFFYPPINGVQKAHCEECYFKQDFRTAER